MKKLFLIALAAVLAATPVLGAGFDYVYINSYLWVPGTSTNQMLDLGSTFGGEPPRLLVLRSNYGADGTDFRVRLIQGRYISAAGLRDGSGSTLISTSLSAASKDTIFDQALGTDGIGCTICPAAGSTFYGSFDWLAAPASTDTIIVDAYKLR